MEAITVGTEVYAGDGEKVGEVVAVHPLYVVVERGLIAPDTLYLPSAAVRAEGDRLLLAVAASAVDRQGWGHPPAGSDPSEETAVFPTGGTVHLDTDEDGGSGGGR